MKRLFRLSILLLALMLPALATAHKFEVDGIYYNIDGTTATVTYRGTSYDQYSDEYSGDVTIPETVTYNGTTYSVTSINWSAFSGCTGLTNVTIPNSVTSIGGYAFEGCRGLIGIDIPNSVTSIRDTAFRGCTSLTSVNIPNSVTSIGEWAFEGCTSLTSVNIPNSVSTIVEWAFRGCSGLTSITIPNSVTTIGRGAFEFCSGLTSITVESGNTKYDSRSNCNAIIETASNTLIGGCKNTVIPNSVTSIGGYAFEGCSGLTSIDIPNSVTSIGECAFSGCTGLTNVTIPNSVTSIGGWAFNGCSGLTSIDIPNSVTTIGDGAFYDCSYDVYSYITDLTEITMGSYVFSRSSNNYDGRTLHVPAGSLEAYQADTKWSKYFGSIVEIEMEPDPVLAESIKLNVTTAGLNEGATLQLTATVLPEDCADKTVLWSSDNPSVATIDNNGLVTTHSVGTATITAMTTDGSNLSTTCTVTLHPVGVKGDVNGDNNISISDVTALIDYLLSGTWN